MDYQRVIRQCPNPIVVAALELSLSKLFEIDMDLLERNLNERTIAHRLAMHMSDQFEDYSIDAEYNRMGDVPKRLTWRGQPDLVYPDIIVHHRGRRSNLLVMEVKKSSNQESRDDDCQKLLEFRRDPDFLYSHAMFIRFGVTDLAGTVTECDWI